MRTDMEEYNIGRSLNNFSYSNQPKEDFEVKNLSNGLALRKSPQRRFPPNRNLNDHHKCEENDKNNYPNDINCYRPKSISNENIMYMEKPIREKETPGGRENYYEEEEREDYQPYKQYQSFKPYDLGESQNYKRKELMYPEAEQNENKFNKYNIMPEEDWRQSNQNGNPNGSQIEIRQSRFNINENNTKPEKERELSPYLALRKSPQRRYPPNPIQNNSGSVEERRPNTSNTMNYQNYNGNMKFTPEYKINYQRPKIEMEEERKQPMDYAYRKSPQRKYGPNISSSMNSSSMNNFRENPMRENPMNNFRGNQNEDQPEDNFERPSKCIHCCPSINCEDRRYTPNITLNKDYDLLEMNPREEYNFENIPKSCTNHSNPLRAIPNMDNQRRYHIEPSNENKNYSSMIPLQKDYSQNNYLPKNNIEVSPNYIPNYDSEEMPRNERISLKRAQSETAMGRDLSPYLALRKSPQRRYPPTQIGTCNHNHSNININSNEEEIQKFYSGIKKSEGNNCNCGCNFKMNEPQSTKYSSGFKNDFNYGNSCQSNFNNYEINEGEMQIGPGLALRKSPVRRYQNNMREIH
ncbi:MAG: hypothetical protein MJ252_22385 [archaeon]|nr:hypothetical protein [archaeon]